jgi:predicted porin
MRRLNKTLLATASIVGLCAAALPGTAHAASTAALQGEITSLQAQLNALQAQVAQQAMAAKIAKIKAMQMAKAPPPKPKFIKPLVGGAQPAIATGTGGYLFITGDFDAGVRLDSGAGHSIFSVNSGQMRASRITFEGYQDTPYGFRVTGIIEGGLDISQGLGASNPSAAGTAFDFGRYDAAGIGNDTYGYLDFGRQYTPIWSVSAAGVADPFGGSYLGGIAAIAPELAQNSRADNSITYSFAAMFAPGGSNGRPGQPVNAGTQYGFGTSYGTKLFWIGGGFHQIVGYNANDAIAPESSTFVVPAAPTQKPILTEMTIAGSYVTPFARLFAQANLITNGRKIDGNGTGKAGFGKLGTTYDGVDQTDWFVGAVVPTFPHQNFRFIYGGVVDHTNTRFAYNVLQSSYEFDLVKAPGTAVYIEGSVTTNKRNTSEGILGAHNVTGTQITADGTNSVAGSTADSVAAGVRYIF